MRRVLALLMLAGGLAAPAWADEPARGEPGFIALRSASLTLNPEATAEMRIGALEYLGGLILAADDPRFGGYSGLSLDADGGGLWAVSDRGHWLRLDFVRDAAGLPLGVAQAAFRPMLDEAGVPLASRRADAEALRRDATGGFWVTFEREHRLWRYASAMARPQAMPLPPEALGLPSNGGLESLALLAPDGAPLLIAEEAPPARPGISPIWVMRDGAWRRLGWHQSADFRPTDAVGLPDGGLLVLERDLRWVSGWAARLRRVPAAQLRQDEGTVLEPLLLAEWARPYANDNLEAMDIRAGPDGAIWVYLMSDDNHSRLQRSLLMVFKLLEK